MLRKRGGGGGVSTEHNDSVTRGRGRVWVHRNVTTDLAGKIGLLRIWPIKNMGIYPISYFMRVKVG